MMSPPPPPEMQMLIDIKAQASRAQDKGDGQEGALKEKFVKSYKDMGLDSMMIIDDFIKNNNLDLMPPSAAFAPAENTSAIKLSTPKR